VSGDVNRDEGSSVIIAVEDVSLPTSSV